MKKDISKKVEKKVREHFEKKDGINTKQGCKRVKHNSK